MCPCAGHSDGPCCQEQGCPSVRDKSIPGPCLKPGWKGLNFASIQTSGVVNVSLSVSLNWAIPEHQEVPQKAKQPMTHCVTPHRSFTQTSMIKANACDKECMAAVQWSEQGTLNLGSAQHGGAEAGPAQQGGNGFASVLVDVLKAQLQQLPCSLCQLIEVPLVFRLLLLCCCVWPCAGEPILCVLRFSSRCHLLWCQKELSGPLHASHPITMSAIHQCRARER